MKNNLNISILCKYVGPNITIVADDDNGKTFKQDIYTENISSGKRIDLICNFINHGFVKLHLKHLSSIIEDEWIKKLSGTYRDPKIISSSDMGITYSYESITRQGSLVCFKSIYFDRMGDVESSLVDQLRYEGYDCDNLIGKKIAIKK